LENRIHIGRIIAEALIQGKSVHIEGMGILKSERVPARREDLPDGPEWFPPHVSLSLLPEGTSFGPDVRPVLLKHLLDHNEVESSLPAGIQFEGAVQAMIKELRSASTLALPYVGQLNLKQGHLQFSADPSLLKALNVRYEDLSVLSMDSPSISSGETTATAPEDSSSGVESREEEPSDVIATSGPNPEAPSVPKAKPSQGASRRPRRKSASELREDRHGSSKTALLVVAGVSVIIVVVLLIMPLVKSGEDAVQIPALSETVSEDSLTIAVSDSSSLAIGTVIPDSLANSALIEGAPSKEDPTAPSTSESQPQEMPVQASTNMITAETKGYTIIVRSSLDLNVAESARGELSGLNLPMGVLTGSSEETTRYRMGLGVFGNAAKADSVRLSLGDKLPEGSWVYRIR